MIKLIVIKIIGLYQYIISPVLGNNCRFYPSCSTYAKEAMTQHGLRKGVLLSIKRVLKCHPFHPGGIDIVEAKQ